MKRVVYLAIQGDRLVTLKGERVVVVKRLVGFKKPEMEELLKAMVFPSWHWQSPDSNGKIVENLRFLPLKPRSEISSNFSEIMTKANLPSWLLGGKGESLNPETTPEMEQPTTPREEGENRSKDTDEVSEASDQPSEDSALHGGDGNSGEVDSPAETSSQEERTGESQDNNSPNPEGEQAEWEEQDAPTSDSPAEGDYEDNQTTQPTDLSLAGEEDADVSEEERRASKFREYYAPKQPDRGAEVLRNGKTSTIVRTEVVELPATTGENLKKVLLRLFKGWSSKPSEDTGGLVTSPRVSGVGLIREMSTSRWSMSRIYRQELEAQPRMILLAADISGSCSASSGHTVGICQSLTKVWSELLFVTHANGIVATVTKNGVTEQHPWGDNPSFSELVTGHHVLGCVLFGDADGLSELQPIWQQHNCQTIWLDSYRASYGKVQRDCYRRVYGVSREAEGDDKVGFFTGVNNEESAAFALRLALRKTQSA